jgi:hypothetical protein
MVVVAGMAGVTWQVPTSEAQEPGDWCGTYSNWVDHVGNQRAVAAVDCETYGSCDTPSTRDAWIPDSSTPIVTVRIKFNIFCNDDGTNCASSPSGVAAQMSQLNSDFSPYRIEFVEQTEYINSTFYRTFTSSKHFGMKTTYKDDPAHQINVYVVNSSFFFRGLGTFPWDPNAMGSLGGIIMDDDWFGSGFKVLTHEVGHNLGLWHTHHGVSELGATPCSSACYERADGLNADTTGDFAADTPATPLNLVCSDPTGSDSCSSPPTPWAPTQLENYMGYSGCWTMFTAQQAGRMHCWISDALLGWIVCSNDAECDDGDDCTPLDQCVNGICENEVDCEDQDCLSKPACRCDDHGGSGPLVCVNWSGPGFPVADTNYVLTATDPNNPDVKLLTGNDGWAVWSQVSRTDDTPANLGHITIDPTSPTENFSVTLAHGPLHGAANVTSISLVDAGWTGQSNIPNLGITGQLTGDLTLEADGSGSGGVLSGVYIPVMSGDITAKQLANFVAIGQASGDITTEEVTGTLKIDDLSGALTIGRSSGSVVLGEVNGRVEGTDILELTVSTGVGPSGDVVLYEMPTNAELNFLGSDFSGDLLIIGPYSGSMFFDNSPALYSTIDVHGELSGTLTIDGTLNGDLCAYNLGQGTQEQPKPKPLPPNVQIGAIGSLATICDTTAVVCSTTLYAPNKEPNGNDKNRFISFIPGNAGQETAIVVNMGSLHHPAAPPNAPDFTDSEEQVRYVNTFKDGSNNPIYTCPDTGSPTSNYKCATLGCEPEYRDWGTALGSTTTLHVTAPEIVPSSVYNIHMIDLTCGEPNWAAFTPGVIVETAVWGDANGNGVLNAIDVGAVVDKAKNVQGAISEPRAMLQPNDPTPVTDRVTSLDVAAATDAVRSRPYRYAGPDACP